MDSPTLQSDFGSCQRARRIFPRSRLEPRPGLRHALEHTVAQVFGIERELLSQPTRGEASVARARQVAMYLAHVGYGLTLTEVGTLFGRDRTTVAHACRVVEEHREDTTFDRAMDLLEGVARSLAEAGVQ